MSKILSFYRSQQNHRSPNPTDGADCPMDPYAVNVQSSHFVDQQILKLQESPDMVPVGELPRHMLLTADR
jgi:DNA replication licensing factor MCM5